MAKETQNSESADLRNAPEGRFDEAALRQAPAKPQVTRFNKCCVHELWAVVEKDGTLVRGRNVTKVNRLAVGIYEVFFTEQVDDGVFVATLGRPGIFTEPPGEITLATRANPNNKGVWVETFDSNGRHQDHGFHLLVHID